MDPKDIFVGGLAIAMGISLVVVSAIGSNAPFLLPKLRWLESKIGRGPSRGCLAILGVGLIVLGVMIARGTSLYGE